MMSVVDLGDLTIYCPGGVSQRSIAPGLTCLKVCFCSSGSSAGSSDSPMFSSSTARQGLTLVHFSAQVKRFRLDRGYI